MTLLWAILLGTVLMLAGSGYACRGHTVSRRMNELGHREPEGFGRRFALHVQTKKRRAAYFGFFLTLPFISWYLWEWFFEPEFLVPAFLASLPGLLLVLFTALTLPFRIEST